MMKSNEGDETQSDDQAAETAAAEVAKADDTTAQSAAQQQSEAEKEVPIDDNSKTQTKEAEQTGETTISDSNADK